MNLTVKSRATIATALVTCFAMILGAPAFAAEAKKVKKKAAPAAEGAADAADAASGDAAATGKAAAAAGTKGHRAPYGMAGCGLGSLIIKKNSMGPQIGASFLNMTGYQMFALTTGCSNCGATKDSVAKVEQEVFMEVNMASLAKDAAQGQGEHLSAFAEILGCGQGDSLILFNAMSRSHYEQIFQGQNSKAVLSNYRNVIKENEKLAKSCVRA